MFGLGLVVLLTACGGEGEPQAAEGARRIDCAIGADAEFGPDCLIEREERDGVTLLVVRHPGGGYRRFVQPGGGGAIETADGADEATTLYRDGVVEVAVAGERYRFPARVIEGDGAGD